MPTVSYKCKSSGKNKKRIFPYNAVGKAQSHEFAKLMGGKKKNNPSMRQEERTVTNTQTFGEKIEPYIGLIGMAAPIIAGLVGDDKGGGK